jgi:hypothetical protein
MLTASQAMKTILIGMTAIGLSAPLVLQSASAQDIDPQCSKMRDKVACTCALQNGGRITQPVGDKRQGWWFRRHEARQPSDPPDSERINFPAKFKIEHWRVRPSRAVEGYLACMHRHGRK